jgi:hypothetical protein
LEPRRRRILSALSVALLLGGLGLRVQLGGQVGDEKTAAWLALHPRPTTTVLPPVPVGLRILRGQEPVVLRALAPWLAAGAALTATDVRIDGDRVTFGLLDGAEHAGVALVHPLALAAGERESAVAAGPDVAVVVRCEGCSAKLVGALPAFGKELVSRFAGVALWKVPERTPGQDGVVTPPVSWPVRKWRALAVHLPAAAKVEGPGLLALLALAALLGRRTGRAERTKTS